MKLKGTDPKAAEVLAVFVDNKRILCPLEFDTEEGWVIAAVPILPDIVRETGKINPDTDNPEDPALNLQWGSQVFRGKVEVIFREKKADS